MRRVVTSLVAGATGPVGPRSAARAVAIALAAAVAAGSSAGRARAEEPGRVPLLSCGSDVCLVVQQASDRDGDGVGDEDEKAAGTDPDDASSRPPTRSLLELFAKDALPSFQDAMASLVVLPTVAPDGTSIFGGLAALPSRKSAIEGLGLTSDLMGGLDLANGLSIGRGTGESSGGGAPPIRVGGISIGLISAGGGGEPTGLVSGALGKSPNRFWVTDSVTVGPTTSLPGGGTMGYSRIVYDDGSVDEVNWQTEGDTSRVTVTSSDASGGRSGSTSASETTRADPDGTRTSTKSTTTTDAKGNTTSSTTTTTAFPDGSAVRETSSKTTKTNKDGSTTTTTTGTVTTTAGGVLQDQVSTTVTETCKGGECSTKTTTTGSSTECDASKDSCSGQAGAYVNPDDTTNDPVSAETVNAVLAVLGSNIEYADPPVDLSGATPPGARPGLPLVILVDPDHADHQDGVVLVKGDPRQVTKPAPDYDPNLPNPLADAGGPGGEPGCVACGGQ